jgi:hypothetical protein
LRRTRHHGVWILNGILVLSYHLPAGVYFVFGQAPTKHGDDLTPYPRCEAIASPRTNTRPHPYRTRSVRRAAAQLCAGHVQQFGGASPPANLMEVKA